MLQKWRDEENSYSYRNSPNLEYFAQRVKLQGFLNAQFFNCPHHYFQICDT